MSGDTSNNNNNGDLDASHHLVKKEGLDLDLDNQEEEEEDDVDMEEATTQEEEEGMKKEEEEEGTTITSASTSNVVTTSLLFNDDEEEEEEEEDDDPVILLSSSSQPQPQPAAAEQEEEEIIFTKDLIKDIVIPSPFAHHNTSDRYRNALVRVQSNPTRDIEAWQAIMNECTQCYRTHILPLLRPTSTTTATTTTAFNNPLWMRKYGSAAAAAATVQPPSSYSQLQPQQPPQLQQQLQQDSSTQQQQQQQQQQDLYRKLDWVESCYGNLLQYFPYASGYYVGVVDMLMASTTLPSDMPNLSKQHNFVVPSVGGGGEKELTKRQQMWESKMEHIFQFTLGVHMDGTDATSSTENENVLEYGMCTSCIDLWLFYIEKRARNVHRTVQKQLQSQTSAMTPATASSTIRDAIIHAYETALSHGGSFVVNNHTLWKQYLEYVQSWTLSSSSSSVDNHNNNTTMTSLGEDIHALQQLQMAQLRSVYQRIVTLPMTGLDSLYLEYEAHERQQSEALATALIAEYQPKYQHARSVYLERARIYNIHELRVGRLPTPPIDPQLDSHTTTTTTTTSSSTTTTTATTTVTPGTTTATATTTSTTGPTGVVTMVGTTDTTLVTTHHHHPDGDLGISSSSSNKKNTLLMNNNNNKNAASSGHVEEDTSTLSWLTLVSNDEYKAKLSEEAMILTKWKRRCAYERTNPERLTPFELTQRIRQSYKDAICAFMRHIEVWHEWSTWELYNPNETNKRKKVAMSLSVLSLAQSHLPDCTLLAWSTCQTVQLYWTPPTNTTTTTTTEDAQPPSSVGEKAIQIMQDFCNSSHGNTLSYILLQQLVRKYKGIQEARAIFAQARRSLRIKRHDYVFDATTTTNTNDTTATATTTTDGVVTRLDVTTSADGATTTTSSSQSNANHDATTTTTTTTTSNETDHIRRMVVNRPLPKSNVATSTKQQQQQQRTNDSLMSKGFITWHLYAAHAEMEYLFNGCPDVAVRVYELGLRKHRSFLSTPPYVLQYANLLLRLGDTDTTRTLLVRAIAAVKEEGGGDDDNNSNNNNDPILAASRVAKREAQRPLWDILLKLQSLSSFSNSGTAHSVSTLQTIESRRRKALFGMTMEDVVGATATSMDDTSPDKNNNTITNSKLMALSDSLFRNDGYDVTSRIAHGLDRIVDSLEITGLLRGTGSNAWSFASVTAMSAGLWNNDSHDDEAGGSSDASFIRRMRFQRASHALKFALSATGANNIQGTMMTAGGTVVASASTATGASSANAAAAGTSGKFYNAAASRFMNNQTNNPAVAAAQQQIQAAIQSSPEWLRGLLLLLPLQQQLQRHRGGTTTPILSTKPPPHMIEMALTALLKNDLPSVRPVDTTISKGTTTANAAMNPTNSFLDGNKRKREDNNDSSDDEGDNGNTIGVGGYGAQFRSRQRARLMMTAPSLTTTNTTTTSSNIADNE